MIIAASIGAVVVAVSGAALQESASLLQTTGQPAVSRVALRRAKRMARLRPAAQDFPAFGFTVHPVDRVPNWGAMRTHAEWSRRYDEMNERDFVPVPPYDLARLGRDTGVLLARRTPDETQILTEKLYYSTRFLAPYGTDVREEFTGTHAGVDLKLALGTPLRAIAGGRIQRVAMDDRLGLHIIIEHRHPDDGVFFSVYGHLESVDAAEGDFVSPGRIIGASGNTGKSLSPHLHLQVDRPGEQELGKHVPYQPASTPTPEQALRRTVHPIRFIETYARTVVAGE